MFDFEKPEIYKLISEHMVMSGSIMATAPELTKIYSCNEKASRLLLEIYRSYDKRVKEKKYEV